MIYFFVPVRYDETKSIDEVVGDISFTALFFIIQWTRILDKFVSL